eukprot:gene17129-23432_t
MSTSTLATAVQALCAGTLVGQLAPECWRASVTAAVGGELQATAQPDTAAAKREQVCTIAVTPAYELFTVAATVIDGAATAQSSAQPKPAAGVGGGEPGDGEGILKDGDDNNDSELISSSSIIAAVSDGLVPLVRLLRNCCAGCTASQNILAMHNAIGRPAVDALLEIVHRVQKSLLAENKDVAAATAAAAPSAGETPHTASPTTVAAAERKKKLVFLKSTAQMFGNMIDAVWGMLCPHTLRSFIASDDFSLSNVGGMILHNCTVGNVERLTEMVESVEGRWLIAAVLETVERAQEEAARENRDGSAGSARAAAAAAPSPPPTLEWHTFFLESIFENGWFTGCPKPPSENPPAGPGEGYDGPPIPPSAHWEEHPLAADDNDNSSASEAKISEVVADAVGADGEEGGRSLDTPAQAQQPTAAARGGGDVGGGGGGGGGEVKLNSKESSPHYGGLCKVLLLKAARQLIEQRSARATPSATTAAKGGAAGSKPAKTKASTLQTSMSPINETAASASSPTQQKAGGEAAEAGAHGGKAAVGELVPPGTIRFMSERLQLLGFLAQDEEWWEEEDSYFYAATV